MNPNDDNILDGIISNEEAIKCEQVENLQEDDIQCGVIFYNEMTRVLKFYCTYCEKVSDNINYFCYHLSEHINGNDYDERTSTENSNSDIPDETTSVAEKVKRDEVNDGDCIAYDEEEASTLSSGKTVPFMASHTESLLPIDLTGFDESKMVVEELDEAEEIAAEVEAEMRQQLETEFKSTKAKEGVEGGIENNTEFENIFNTDTKEIHSHLHTGVNKKKKRITTVKVIALKNRVAELYERIKYEEERRSRISELDGDGPASLHAQNMNTGIYNLLDGMKSDSGTPSSSNEHIQKIIGETVITLLPVQSQKQFDFIKTSNTDNAAEPHSINNNDCLEDKTVCPACGRKFRSAFSLTIHKRTHYLESDSNVKLAHKCSDCDQLFNKIPDLKEHIQEVHYPDGFICKICSRRLTSLTLLETHMRKIHLTRPFNCEICRKNFDTRDRYEEHVKAHVSGQPYRCHICGRKYSTECILKQHMRRHKEQVPQCCVVCGKLTLRITQHMKIHAPRPKKVLSCQVCGRMFNFSSGLSHHYKIMHKLVKSPTHASKSNRRSDIPVSDSEIKTDEFPEHIEESIEIDAESELDAGEESRGDSEEINQKEEEAKRVIVELIQNATYSSFFPENFNSSIDCGPPIAREETISAVNSIVHEGG